VFRSPFARESPTPDGSANGKAGQRLPRREYEPEWGGDARAERCLRADLPGKFHPPSRQHIGPFHRL
jgi:hypothetical protein